MIFSGLREDTDAFTSMSQPSQHAAWMLPAGLLFIWVSYLFAPSRECKVSQSILLYERKVLLPFPLPVK